MASTLLSSNMMNLVEAQKRDGFTKESEFLANFVEENDFLKVAPWSKTSSGLVDKSLKLVSAAEGSWGMANKGISSGKNVTDSEILTLKLYDGMSQVDERIFRGVDHPEKVRQTEDIARLQGISDGWLNKVLYSEDTDDGFAGIFTRRNKIDKKGRTCFDAGGTASGSLTSILIVEFGEEKGMTMLYKEGEPAGIKIEDRGRHMVDAPDGSGSVFAWITYFSIMANIKIRNERSVIRIANIDPTGEFPMSAVIEAKNYLPSKGKRNTVMFVNRAVATMVDKYLIDKSQMSFSRRDIEGWGAVPEFFGMPILSLDAISDAEAKLS